MTEKEKKQLVVVVSGGVILWLWWRHRNAIVLAGGNTPGTTIGAPGGTGGTGGAGYAGGCGGACGCDGCPRVTNPLPPAGDGNYSQGPGPDSSQGIIYAVTAPMTPILNSSFAPVEPYAPPWAPIEYVEPVTPDWGGAYVHSGPRPDDGPYLGPAWSWDNPKFDPGPVTA